MLGEYLGELKGKITSRRVLDVTNCPNLEVNVTREGKLKGAEITELVTYSTTRKSDGHWYGHGQGVIMTKDGSDTTTFTGEGIGHYAGSAKLKYAGSNLFGPSKGKLEFLNNSVLIFEIDIDLETLDDNIKLWEWK
jgi:hypothetical protein